MPLHFKHSPGHCTLGGPPHSTRASVPEYGVIMAQQHSHPKKQKWPETQNSESTEGAKWCGRWRLLALGDWQIGQVQVDWKDSWPQLFHSDSSIWSYNPTINIIHLPEAKTSLGFGAESLRKANTIIPLKPFVAWLHFNEKFHPSRFWGQLGPQKTETMSRRPTSTSLWRMRKWPLKKETVNANIATWVWCFPVVFGPLDRSFLFFRCGHSERGPNFVYNTTQPSPVPCSMVPSCFLSETPVLDRGRTARTRVIRIKFWRTAKVNIATFATWAFQCRGWHCQLS